MTHEKLVVYGLAVKFSGIAPGLAGKDRALRDQISRASSSIVNNIAEGAGRWARDDKKHFYRIARGSTCECAAVVDTLAERKQIAAASAEDAKAQLQRIYAMLSGLCR